MSIPKIEEGAQFLQETGLLAEINRKVLHPLGLALAVNAEADGSVSFLPYLFDFRKDPEGMHFSEETLQDIANKLATAPQVSSERLRLFPNGIQALPQPKNTVAEEVLKTLRDD